MKTGRRRTSEKIEKVLIGPFFACLIFGYFMRPPAWFWLLPIALASVMIVALWRRAGRNRNPIMAQVDKMTGQEFEDFVADLLRRQGYQVKSVGGYEDMGIDLVATNPQGIRHAIQAKCWNARQVDMSAVRAAVARRQVHNCHKSVVITNNYFTRRAISLAQKNDCKLIDREVLDRELRKLAAT